MLGLLRGVDRILPDSQSDFREEDFQQSLRWLRHKINVESCVLLVQTSSLIC